MTWVVRSVAFAGTLLAVAATDGAAQDSVTVVPGPRYEAGWFTKLMFGDDYRDLWTTPITVPVLDLAAFAGGLTPVRTGGYGQTISLHFDGADRKRYVFRSIDKDLSRRLEEAFLGTFVQDIIQDQTSAYHPTAALVTAPLVEAAGVLAARPQIFVMPDDPRLGEYRDAYRGMLGLMMENPDEGPDNTPGFAGSTRVSGSDRVLDETEDSPETRVDAVGFLKARLMDIFLGDRDRHKGQWKWARFERPDGSHVWEVVAEDRDQPFVKQDGFVLWVARTFFVRKLTNFAATYSNLAGLTWNAWDLDRRFLSSLDRTVWDSVATDLQIRLSDEVIEEALDQMPPSFYTLRAHQLRRELRSRRDSLHVVAGEYYRMLAGWVDIHATDEDEFALIEHRPDGNTEVRIVESKRDDAVPHFHRVFRPSETREIRVDLHGGDDRAEVRGRGAIKVRVIGGGGRDTLIDESPNRVYFYDEGNGTEFVRGRGTRIDRRDFDPPPSPDFAHERPPDWGSWLRPLPTGSFAPDIGAFVGGGFTRFQYGFRKFPYSSRVTITGGFAFGANQPSFALEWERRHVQPGVHVGVDAKVSGLDIIRFHGFGNETPAMGPSSFFKVRRTQSVLETPVVFEPVENITFRFTPIAKLSLTDRDEPTFLANLAPEGIGTFGQAGVSGQVRIERRNRPVAATEGFSARIEGQYYPAIWDVDADFGRVAGEAAGYLTFGPTLALRVGGAKAFGDYPFHEAAYVGGSSTVRGFAEQRFAGDASAYGNAELRARLTKLRIVFPLNLGVHALADVGRVFFSGDPAGADTWHTAFGGGVWFALIDPANTISFSVAGSEEQTSVYIGAGFFF